MAASVAKPAFGTLFKKGATTIAEVTSISGPGMTRDTIEVSHMESPSGAKEFVGGMTDAGEVTIEMNFLPANSTQKDFAAELYSGTADSYSIVWADATWTFTAFCTGLDPTGGVGTALTATATFKLTGFPTFPA